MQPTPSPAVGGQRTETAGCIQVDPTQLIAVPVKMTQRKKGKPEAYILEETKNTPVASQKCRIHNIFIT